ncbi:unnamed protein product [Victoria cruziana]
MIQRSSLLGRISPGKYC